MKKSLFLSTLLTAAALTTPAWATDYTFGANNTTSTADDLVAGGDGSQDSPYYFTECGSSNRVSITISGDNSIFTASGTTVYLGSDTQSFGAAGVNSFFANSVTAACDIVIGAAGIYLTNGTSNNVHTFSGKISGTGDWTVSYYGTGNNQGSAVTQHYVFTGDLSEWTGNFTISTPDDDYVYYGNGGTAATNTNISGNGGSISVDYGEVRYNYSDYAEGTSATALTVTNSSIEGHKVTFTGSVNYEVSSTITGWDASSGSVATTSSTLTVSNTGTTTFTGAVSNFDNVTVSSSSTLAIGTGGSLDLSNATVNLGSTIQNSGTVIINESTIFALDNLSYTGDVNSETGATYTLITGSGSVTVDTSLLGLDNVSSSSEITSATFNYADGVLTVTVIELEDGLHGDGTSSSPYYTSGSGTLALPTTGEGGIFAGDSSTTVYIATEDHSLGTADENVYWANGSFTAACNIVIGKAGIYLDNGFSGQTHTFTGAISGEGSWTINSSGVNQDYIFTGDLSQWSGDFTITGSSASYVCYGDGKTVAATDTNVTGTGAISVANGTVAFDYVKEDESGNKGPETVTIGNSSITAATIEFAGSVDYIVSAGTTITSGSSSGSFVVSTEGTVTILGTLTTGSDSNAFSSLSVAEGSTLRIGANNTFYMDTTSTAGNVFVVSGTLEVAEGVSFTLRKRSAATGYTIANLSLENGSTFTLYTYGTNQPGSSGGLSIGNLTVAGSATMTTNYWQNYVTIGTLVSSGTTGATLTLSSSAGSTVATIYEFGGSNTESSFTGKITLSDTDTGDYRGVTLIISDAYVAAGAVVEMGAEGNTNGALALGVNAEKVEIAGLVSSNSGGDIVYSGAVSAGATLGNQGATLIDYSNQSGYGSGSNYDNVGTSRNTLVINTAAGESYSFSGVILDKVNIEKSGAGTQSIEFKTGAYQTTNYFDGSISVNAGTLNLSGEAIESSGITVASGATLGIANTITLAEGSTSTIAGTLSVTETGSLALSGSVELSSAIQNAGTITIANGTSITVGVEVQTGAYNDANYQYYELITGSGSGSVTLGDSVTFVIDGTEITLSNIATLADGDTDWKGYISGGSLYIYAETSTVAQTADNLYWAGTEDNNTWSTSTTDTPWSDTESGSSGYYFAEKANVTFGPNTDGSLSTTVVLGGDITAGTVNITGSGYTLTGSGYTLTATSIVLDDEDSASEHKFTIDTGVKVTAGSLTEKAGQLDLVVNGELDVTTMTVTTTQDESISGSGKLTVGTLEYSSDHGVSLTISVAEATFESITEQVASGTESSGELRHLIFGDGTSTTTASADYMEIRGLSEVQVASGSTLTVTELYDASGWNTTISGDGSIKIGSMTVSGNATSATLNISIANFESGAITFSGTVALTISSASFKADSIVFSGGGDNDNGAGAITISGSTKATIGTIESAKTHTITIANGGELTTGEIYRSGSTLKLVVDGTLTVDQLSGYGEEGETTSGMIYFGKDGSSTTMAQTISGSGTVNAYGIEAYFGTSNNNHLTISVANLNIGEGGITESTGSRLYINGTTIGLYNATNVTIAANMVIDSDGATFKTNEAEKLTLSGTVTGNGLVTKTGDGELAFTGTGSSLSNGLTVSAGTVSVAENASLTLGGTVTLASAISNAGTITIADSTSFVLDNLTMGTGGGTGNRDYYVLITGNGGSLSGTITIDNFTLTDGDLSNWSVYTDNGYLVIYGEAQTTEGQSGNPLVWDGTEADHTWNSGDSSNAIWQNDSGGTGYYFTNGNDVTFGATDAYTTVAVESENAITAGSITVNSAYTFDIGDGASVTTGSLTYADGGSLTLTGTGTFVFDGETAGTDFTISTSNDFTGTLEVAKGLLDLAKVSLGTSTKLVIDAIGDKNTSGVYETNGSNAIFFSEGNTTLANDLAITGSSGGVILRSAGTEITLSGSVTGDTGTTLQLNGNGTANFTGKVSLSNYINYQGATIFKNETTLGSLEIYQAESNKGDVTFTGSDAQATVTALTVHATTGTGTATLTVSDGASLSVETMAINDDFAITIDKAAMSITTSVTQASGTSTSITISNGGTLSLGSDVSLNVAAMEIVLGTDTYTGGVYVITGESTSSLVVSEAAIKITVDSALASLLETDGTYSFNIYEGLSLSENVFDISDILSYSEDVSWDNGVLTVIVGSGAIPEPSMFGFFFGLGAIGLVATRRRRR